MNLGIDVAARGALPDATNLFTAAEPTPAGTQRFEAHLYPTSPPTASSWAADRSDLHESERAEPVDSRPVSSSSPPATPSAPAPPARDAPRRSPSEDSSADAPPAAEVEDSAATRDQAEEAPQSSETTGDPARKTGSTGRPRKSGAKSSTAAAWVGLGTSPNAADAVKSATADATHPKAESSSEGKTTRSTRSPASRDRQREVADSGTNEPAAANLPLSNTNVTAQGLVPGGAAAISDPAGESGNDSEPSSELTGALDQPGQLSLEGNEQIEAAGTLAEKFTVDQNATPAVEQLTGAVAQAAAVQPTTELSSSQVRNSGEPGRSPTVEAMSAPQAPQELPPDLAAMADALEAGPQSGRRRSEGEGVSQTAERGVAGNTTEVGPARRFASHLAAGSGERTSRTAPLSNVEQARFLERVSRAFKTAEDRGGTVTLRLHPPELGALRVELQIREGVLSARLEAESPAAQALLLDNSQVLRDRLADQGIRVERFDVELMDPRSPNDSSAFERQTPREEEAARRSATKGPHTEATESESPRVRPRTTPGSLNVIV